MLELVALIFLLIAAFAILNGLWVWLFVTLEMSGAAADEPAEVGKLYFPPVWGDLPHYTHAR